MIASVDKSDVNHEAEKMLPETMQLETRGTESLKGHRPDSQACLRAMMK